MLGLQRTASGHVAYPSRSSNLCRVSRTTSSITSGFRMSLIWSGKKSNIGTKKQLLLLHTRWGQGSLVHSNEQRVSLEGCGQTRLSWQRVNSKVNFARGSSPTETIRNQRIRYWQFLIFPEGHTPVFGKGRNDLNRSIVQKNIPSSWVGCHCEWKQKTIQILLVYEKRIASDHAGRNHREKLYSKRSNWGSLPAVQDTDKNRRPVSVQYMTLAFSFVLKVYLTLIQSQI